MLVMKGVSRCLRMPKAGGADRPYSAEMALSHPLTSPQALAVEDRRVRL